MEETPSEVKNVEVTLVLFATFGNVAFYVPYTDMLPAAVGSRFSHTSKPTPEVLAEFVRDGRAAAMIRRLVLGYGHDSAAELVPVFVVISGISIYAAMHIKAASAHFSFIEESTRYIDNAATRMLDVPDVTPAQRALMVDMVDLYERSKPAVRAHLVDQFPFAASGLSREQDYNGVMDKATLDVVRDILPQGMHTRLCLACNARAFFSLLHPPRPHHRVNAEVRATIDNLRAGFTALYPALAHKADDKYDPWVKWPAHRWARMALTEQPPSLALLTPLPTPDETAAEVCNMPGCSEKAELDWDRASRFSDIPADWNATQLELTMTVPFAVFRELDRHRPFIVKRGIFRSGDAVLPPTIAAIGGDLAAEWAAVLARCRLSVISNFYTVIPRLPYAHLPLCELVRARWQIGLGTLIHMLELRSTPGAHPAVRTLMHELHRQLLRLNVLSRMENVMMLPNGSIALSEYRKMKARAREAAWLERQIFVDVSPNAPNFSRK